METRRVIKGIIRIGAIKTWLASLIPMVVATVLAYAKEGAFSLAWWLLSIVGIMLIETGKHCLNDVMDYESGVDLSIDPDKVTPYSGGKKALSENLLTVNEAKLTAKITLTIAIIIGICIVIFKETAIWPIGLAGIFLAVSYNSRPLSFCYRGLGEITVGITYGPLILMGMYVMLTGNYDGIALLASIPLGFLIANVLWINQYPDYEADKMHDKKNWVVRLGKEKGLKVYAALYVLMYLFFAIITVSTMNGFWLINLVSIPLAIRAYRIAAKYYNDIPNLIKANELTLQIYLILGITMAITFILIYLIS